MAAAAASTSRVGVITGANQGVGYGIASLAARQYPTSHFGTHPSPAPLTLYFTARNVERGQQSLEDLRAELKGNKVLSEDGGPTTLRFHQLDITDASSRAALRDFLRQEHGPQALDLLVNNAGIAQEGFDAQVVRDTLATNYYATKEMTKLFLPELKEGGRVVTVASMAGKLKGYSPEVTQRFRDVATEADADALMKEYQESVDADRYEAAGFKSQAYSVSKAGIIALHGALAHQAKKDGRSLLLNTCCPGYVDTRMTKHKGVRTLDEGAATPVALALDDVQGATGQFWENCKESVWG